MENKYGREITTSLSLSSFARALSLSVKFNTGKMLLIRAPVVYDSLHLRYRDRRSSNPALVCMSNNRIVAASSTKRTSISAMEARVSLVFALTSQTASISQRFLEDLVSETVKYVFPRRFDSQSLEEALMAVPDLETVKFKVLSRKNQYEIREVDPYYIAETTMPGRYGFDFNGASQSFNVLAGYLFEYNKGKNGDDNPCFYP